MSPDLLRSRHRRLGKVVLRILELLELVVEINRIKIESLKVFLALEQDVNPDDVDIVFLISLRCILDATC